MILYTGCPGCSKALNIDLRHKEAYAPPHTPTVAARATCEHCRQEINITLTITPHRKEQK